jgi:dipeptidyl aminopeptidase/acylaminoacyl peptidase
MFEEDSMSDPQPVRRPTFAQFAAVRRYSPTLSFSPDGGEVAYSTNTSGQFNLWRQPSAGGYPHQLTFYTDETVRQVEWSPDGQTILYTADQHGDEFHQLHVIPARGGVAAQLTNAPGVQHYLADVAWSPDGRWIAYAGNDRSPTDQDVLIQEVASGEVRRLIAREGLFQPVAWSPDGSLLTVVDVRSNTDMDVHLLTVADGSLRHLTPHEDQVKYLPGAWAADGSGFYLLTDEGREFTGLAFFDLKAGQFRWIETPDWDVEAVEVTADGHYLAWVVNEEGYSRFYLRDLATQALVETSGLPAGVIVPLLRFALNGTKLGLLLARPDHATEIFVLDVATRAWTQITHSMLGGLDASGLVRPTVVHYASHDGRQIPAFLYRPAGAGRVPVVLSIHGGPEAQERPTYMYSGLYQYLLSRGIGVLATNIRGSTGYGKTYQRLIHRDWGGAELGDLEAAAQYLRGLDWVDPARIGVFGGSFGGFATLSCVTRLPDYWAAAVDIVGPSNLITFAKAVPPTWRRFMTTWVGDPETDAEFLLSRSPISYVDQVKTPLFIIQGAKDPRVVKGESDQMVEQLRARGVAVRYDVYEDEGHGFTKRPNELKGFGDTAAFLEQYLL